ncbi:movement protein [Phlomis mottle virus]|uniref:Movement protein n=1 Tax=Phlomis mottle virus TaxID=487095 RepID=A9JQJ6_9VIRU|nr:movement protein [Phlomis mottle virus]CAP46904.1 movement protein [Phlomis mottle virus]
MTMIAKRAQFLKGDSEDLTLNVSKSKIYSDVSPFVSDSSVNVHRSESIFVCDFERSFDGLKLADVPLIPEVILSGYKSIGKFNYVHLASISIIINALFKHKSGVKGSFVLYDGRFTNAKQACISAFKFNLDSGTAYQVLHPNFPVSLSDPFLEKALTGLIVFEDLNMLEGTHSVSLVVGVMLGPLTLSLQELTLSQVHNISDSYCAEIEYLIIEIQLMKGSQQFDVLDAEAAVEKKSVSTIEVGQGLLEAFPGPKRHLQKMVYKSRKRADLIEPKLQVDECDKDKEEGNGKGKGVNLLKAAKNGAHSELFLKGSRGASKKGGCHHEIQQGDGSVEQGFERGRGEGKGLH